ncbi:MAG: class I SAM-dependent methyltransferase, partial [Actinomycetota bacterium]
AMFDAAGPDAHLHGLTTTERARAHGAELVRQPGRYLERVSDNVRDRVKRKWDVQSIKVRQALGASVSDELRIRQFVEDNWASQQAYTFEPYDDAIVVYKAADDPFNIHLVDHDMGWTRVATGPFKVTVVGGEHLSMLAEPHVESLARELATDIASTGGASAADTTRADVEERIIRALQQGALGPTITRLAERRHELEAEAAALVDQVDDVTGRLADAARATGERAVAALAAADLEATLDPVPNRVSVAAARLKLVVDREQAAAQVVETVTAALAAGDFYPQPRAAGAASGTGHNTLAFVDGDGRCRIELRWDGAELKPGDLPTGDGANLGLFLGTPDALVRPLLARADPQAGERVVDLGCGDGRILIEAAATFGCRGRGIETDPRLVAIARSRVEAAGLADRVEIVEADAAEADFADADVVFLFLPVAAAAALTRSLLDRIEPGTRILAHEQLAV